MKRENLGTFIFLERQTKLFDRQLHWKQKNQDKKNRSEKIERKNGSFVLKKLGIIS